MWLIYKEIKFLFHLLRGLEILDLFTKETIVWEVISWQIMIWFTNSFAVPFFRQLITFVIYGLLQISGPYLSLRTPLGGLFAQQRLEIG